MPTSVLEIREALRQRLERPSVLPAPEGHVPVWSVAAKLGVTTAGMIGECSVAGITVTEVADYPGVAVIRASDADRIVRLLRPHWRE
jgi:hypothetical protein